VSTWLVTRLAPDDLERAQHLAGLSGSGFDPNAELSRSWAKVWVVRAEIGAEVLGWALTWIAADEVHLLDLAVEPTARRRGMARALLEAIVMDARANGGRLVLLEVRASNAAARSLYAALGFAQTDVRRAYYSDNGEDAVVMRLDLASCAIGDPR
jgi:ribosomal-protein-alanine N-acetyltransferase